MHKLILSNMQNLGLVGSENSASTSVKLFKIVMYSVFPPHRSVYIHILNPFYCNNSY